MRNTTLLFLVRIKNDQISELCLAQKRDANGFGGGHWNGVGGGVEKGETFVEGAVREAQEEIGVTPRDLKKVAELTFFFTHRPEWNQFVEVFVASGWEGEPHDSEEIVRPTWFAAQELPFDEMWPDDRFWLPEMLKGNFVRARFTFDVGDRIIDQKIEMNSL